MNQYVLGVAALALISAAAVYGRRYFAKAKLRLHLNDLAVREANIERERERHELLTRQITRYVESLDVIHSEMRWVGSAMTIVGWGARSTTRGETTQTVLCRTNRQRWALIDVRAHDGAVSIRSIEQVALARARQFMEPHRDKYIELFSEPAEA